MPHHFRTPDRQGELLLHPEESLAEFVQTNETQLATGHLGDRSLVEVRETARAEVFPLASRWTNDLIGPLNVPEHPEFWIIGGHQPELFHPGVWVKNAAISGLVPPRSGVGLNLIVDHDICTGSSIGIPSSPVEHGSTSLPWDLPRPASPWEERPDPDADCFSTFGIRCQAQLRPWGIEPLAASFDWGAAPDRSLVDRLVQLRSSFERSMGIRNLELKVSDLSDTLCFRRFLWRSVCEVESLSSAYNTALTDFRTRHRVRSRSHPVPPLDVTPEGIEAPFWVWREGETRRNRLFVRSPKSGMLRLHDGRRELGQISATSEAIALAALQDMRRQGWKIRPRALTLTLFTRVCLGSVFVHGIGGARYDEITDELIQNWLKLPPPGIIVASATERLFEQFTGPALEPEIAQLGRELRLIQWNPELISTESGNGSGIAELHAEKAALLAAELAPATRHARLQAINSALRTELADYEQHVRVTQQGLLVARLYQQTLRSREFAAVLFPERALQDLFHQMQQRVSKAKSGASSL